jgi:hypothetical protein
VAPGAPAPIHCLQLPDSAKALSTIAISPPSLAPRLVSSSRPSHPASHPRQIPLGSDREILRPLSLAFTPLRSRLASASPHTAASAKPLDSTLTGPPSHELVHRPVASILRLASNPSMNTVQESTGSTIPPASASPHSSLTLGKSASQDPATVGDDNTATSGPTAKSGSLSKRRLFGFGKKKDGDKTTGTDRGPTSSPEFKDSNMSTQPISPLVSPSGRHASVSPHGSPQPRGSITSPRYRSASPALRSPASSQIFERNVQEGAISGELSPAIPAHIQTEDHIPPVLEASSLAITDDHLNPDEVEIVMHAAHQPASAAVAGSNAGDSMHSPMQEEMPAAASAILPASPQDADETASNYGALDTTDVRRLSFISFADVVQSEHVAESNRDSVHLMSLSSTAANRSPSPVRSPASSHGRAASPPTSGAASTHGMDSSQTKTGAPRLPSPPTGNELTIETMRQALRKTGSGDMSGTVSPPMSAGSPQEASTEQSLK